MVPMNDEPRAPLPALTGLRFLLAAVVLGHHLVAEAHAPDWLLRLTVHLGSGMVLVFFCLSGFVLTYQYAGRQFAPGPFLRARAARLLPAYWLALGAATLLNLARLPAEWPTWLLNALLLQAWLPVVGANTWNGPAWSLSCELAYYLLFPILLPAAVRLRPRLGLALGAALVVMLPLVAQSVLPGPWTAHPLTGLGAFVLGAALGRAHHAGWRLAPRVALGAAAAWPLTIAAAQISTPLWLALTGLLAAPLILALAHERAPRWPRLQELGEASYALYITHAVIIAMLALPFGGLPAWLVLPAGLACVGGSLLVYRWVERPGRRWLLGQRRSRRAAPALA
jgi:peptidoglycan/LPS O-acetylase OafA/YrhL